MQFRPWRNPSLRTLAAWLAMALAAVLAVALAWNAPRHDLRAAASAEILTPRLAAAHEYEPPPRARARIPQPPDPLLVGPPADHGYAGVRISS